MPVQGSVPALKRASGGTQRIAGVFAQDIIALAPRLTLTFGVRFDAWRSGNGHNLETNVPSGTPTAANKATLPDRSDTAVSPRIGAVYHLTDRINLRGSAGTGFRAPTLNELYRQFRVGTVLTLPNFDLGPERLVGGEAGIDVRASSAVTARATWFDNRMRDPVSNVTLTVSGANVTQQRQNLGKTRAWGFQTDVDARIGSVWRFGAAYMFDRATVEEFAANPSLIGNFIPQVPRHRGTIDVTYADARVATIALSVQIVGRQFDDDQNVRTVPNETSPGLPAYALTDISVSRRIAPNVELFAGAQNLFDVEYIVGTLPTTIGTPRLVNVGARIRFTR
jgi:outer membrane receptor protein involved in Fe transport